MDATRDHRTLRVAGSALWLEAGILRLDQVLTPPQPQLLSNRPPLTAASPASLSSWSPAIAASAEISSSVSCRPYFDAVESGLPTNSVSSESELRRSVVSRSSLALRSALYARCPSFFSSTFVLLCVSLCSVV